MVIKYLFKSKYFNSNQCEQIYNRILDFFLVSNVFIETYYTHYSFQRYKDKNILQSSKNKRVNLVKVCYKKHITRYISINIQLKFSEK